MYHPQMEPESFVTTRPAVCGNRRGRGALVMSLGERPSASLTETCTYPAEGGSQHAAIAQQSRSPDSDLGGAAAEG